MSDFNKEEIEKLSKILCGQEVDSIALKETLNDSFLVITFLQRSFEPFGSKFGKGLKVSFRYDWIYDFDIDGDKNGK